MAKVRKFQGARANIVRPLGLIPRDKAESPEEVEVEEVEVAESGNDTSDVQLESLAVAGAPLEVVEAAQSEDEGEVEDDSQEDGGESMTIEIVDEEAAPNPDDMTKAELRELAEKLGVDPEGRIDHLRSRVSRALKEA